MDMDDKSWGVPKWYPWTPDDVMQEVGLQRLPFLLVDAATTADVIAVTFSTAHDLHVAVQSRALRGGLVLTDVAAERRTREVTYRFTVPTGGDRELALRELFDLARAINTIPERAGQPLNRTEAGWLRYLHGLLMEEVDRGVEVGPYDTLAAARRRRLTRESEALTLRVTRFGLESVE